MLTALKQRLVRWLYPYGAIRKVRRGPLAGWRIRVGPAMGFTYVWGKEAGHWHELSQYVGSGNCVYDVGANRGQSTLHLAKVVGQTGRVIAFEPVPGNFADLQANIELNELTQVSLVCAAAGEAAGTAEFLFDSTLPTQGKISAHEPTYQLPQAAMLQVQVIALDDYRMHGWPPPDFIKIDVEGGGAGVLRGARQLIETHKPIIYFEQHGPEEQAAARDLVIEHQYHASTLDGREVPDPTAGWFDPLVCRPRIGKGKP